MSCEQGQGSQSTHSNQSDLTTGLEATHKNFTPEWEQQLSGSTKMPFFSSRCCKVQVLITDKTEEMLPAFPTLA